MELIDDVGHRAIRLAGTLGLAQEALRLGCTVVGTEHLLMATLCDPVIRWKVKGLGVDMRDVQELVRRTVDRRRSGGAAGFAMTGQAAALLQEAAARADLEPGTRPDPDVYSATMIALMSALIRDENDTAAGAILTELGLIAQSSELLEALGSSATAALLLPSLSLEPAEGGVP